MKDYILGQKIYENTADFDGKMSMPYVVVEIYPDHIIGFNPEADMTCWIDKDNEENIDDKPKYNLFYEFEKDNDDVLRDYAEYLSQKGMDR